MNPLFVHTALLAKEIDVELNWTVLFVLVCAVVGIAGALYLYGTRNRPEDT